MASENKKKKAKNSYLRNGNEAQKIYKMKRVAYYIKADRKYKIESEETDADYKVSSDGRTVNSVCGYIAPTIIEADEVES